MEQKYRILFWLLRGEDEELNNDDLTLVAAKYRRTAGRMRVRAALKSKLAPGALNITTGGELMELINNYGPNDAILGHNLFVKDDSKFNELTFDHIIPVSTVKNDPDAFSIYNIQLMSKCLNDVKCAYHDYELIFWLDTLLGCYLDRYGF